MIGFQHRDQGATNRNTGEGAATGLLLFPNGNGNEVRLAIDKGPAHEIAFASTFMKAGSFNVASYDNIVHIVKGFTVIPPFQPVNPG